MRIMPSLSKTLTAALLVVAISSLLVNLPSFRACVLSVTVALLDKMVRALSRDNGYEERYVRDVTGDEILQQGEYDVIIVGAGPAGSVIANRLSENPHWKILLLEAGKEESFLTDIPALTPFISLTDYDWGYKTEPQEQACLAMTNRRCVWPRGKALGGTTILNHMIYSRGSKQDYDEWAQLGNNGWNYEEILPYFLKSEHVRIPGLENSVHHSANGFLSVELNPYQTILSKLYLEAGQELGYDIAFDYNGESIEGFTRYQQTMRNGSRCSASKAFLRPVRNRTNLHISQNSRVIRVIINPTTKIATGVEFTKNGIDYQILAKKEVVLSSGALNSPQILMLSGIGPKDHLKELDIPVIKDLQVGQGLQDHVGFLGLTFLVNDTVGIVQTRLSIVDAVSQYIVNGSGVLALASNAENMAFVKTKFATNNTPDIELLFATASLNIDNGGQLLTELIGLTPEMYEDVYRTINNRDVFTIVPIVMKPKSRGFVKLFGDNPFRSPKFDPKYLSHPQDIELLVEGIKIAIQLSGTKAFQQFGATLHNVSIPVCKGLVFGSDQYWKCAIKQLTGAMHHQIGTCRMGPETDANAVVDPELRVYGIKGLRVADASIIPQQITGHPSAAVYMIGEKASDLIKLQWGG